MPVQINEVIIRAVVDSRPASDAVTTGAERGDGSHATEAEPVEKLMEIIREKQER